MSCNKYSGRYIKKVPNYVEISSNSDCSSLEEDYQEKKKHSKNEKTMRKRNNKKEKLQFIDTFKYSRRLKKNVPNYVEISSNCDSSEEEIYWKKKEDSQKKKTKTEAINGILLSKSDNKLFNTEKPAVDFMTMKPLKKNDKVLEVYKNREILVKRLNNKGMAKGRIVKMVEVPSCLVEFDNETFSDKITLKEIKKSSNHFPAINEEIELESGDKCLYLGIIFKPVYTIEFKDGTSEDLKHEDIFIHNRFGGYTLRLQDVEECLSKSKRHCKQF